MATDRIRGIEVPIRITVDGEQKVGFEKVNDFTWTQRADIPEKPYLGEQETDLDFRHDGWELSWTMDVTNNEVEDVVNLIVEREQNRLPHPNVVVTVFYNHRSGAQERAIAYYDCFLLFREFSVPGRDEYTSYSCTAKCKRRVVIDI